MSTRHTQRRQERSMAHEGRLVARPSTHPAHRDATAIGLTTVGIPHARDGVVYVPASYVAAAPAPFALMFHGAGGRAEHGIDLLREQADRLGIIVLATQSQRATWDMMSPGFGVDIEAIEHALDWVFERYAVDQGRVAVGGFSDGASYALSVGVMNGDLFSHIIAFSPGYMAPTSMRGNPHMYISHGTRDAVLPVDRCSRRLVPKLRNAGYHVAYDEFDGPHTVPERVADQAADWFVARDAVTE